MDVIDRCRDLATLMNPSSFSTLTLLHFRVSLYADDFQDPLSGICDELAAIAGHNVIEELDLEILAYADYRHMYKTSDHWGGRLDDVLATGFPRLGRVSLHVLISTIARSRHLILADKVKKLQFPWLSKNSIVKFNFSVKFIGEYYPPA